MKSLLAKTASVAVMLHMMFGCGIHHGFGTMACAHPVATACNHEHVSHCDVVNHEANNHQHYERQPPVSEPICNDDGKSDNPGHLGCCDDSCYATQIVKYKLERMDFSVPYLGGADTLALIERQRHAGLDADPFPDCSRLDKGMRVHLLFGVQII